MILFAQNRGQRPNYNVHMRAEKKTQLGKKKRTISTTIDTEKQSQTREQADNEERREQDNQN